MQLMYAPQQWLASLCKTACNVFPPRTVHPELITHRLQHPYWPELTSVS